MTGPANGSLWAVKGRLLTLVVQGRERQGPDCSSSCEGCVVVLLNPLTRETWRFIHDKTWSHYLQPVRRQDLN